MNYLSRVLRFLALALVLGLALSPQIAYASSTCDQSSANCATYSSQTSPWDQSTQQLENLLTGAPAKAISIIAIVVAGVALVFGEDLGAFAKRLLMVVIAISMIVGAGSIVATVFGATL